MIGRVAEVYRRFMVFLMEKSVWKNPFSPVFLTWYFLRKRIEEARPFFRGTIVDNGCGKKPYSDIVNKTSRYIGFDYPQLVFNNKNFKKDLRPDIYGDGFALPFRSESVDCVMNTQVMEYIPDPDNFIHEMVRILKPGGNLIMSVPFTYPIHHETHDFFRYTKAGIVYLLEKNGLQMIWIKANGGFWVTIGQLFLYFLNFKFLFRSRHDILWMFFSGIRLALIPIILLINCMVNCVVIVIDKVWSGSFLTLNYSLLVQKKGEVFY